MHIQASNAEKEVKKLKTSKKAALCGVSAALGSILLMLARLDLPVQLTLYALSSIALMIPLAQRLYRGAVLTLIATALIGFITGGIMVALPYAFFFGLHPIVNALMDKYIKDGKLASFIKIVLKIIFFAALFYGAFLFAQIAELLPPNINKHIFALILAAVFVPYDYLMQLVQKRVTFLMSHYLKL